MDLTNGHFMKTTNATKAALTGLEWAISQSVEKPRQKGEFTLTEYIFATGKTEAAASYSMKKMGASGEIVFRQVSINGKRANLYRKP